MLKYLYKLIEVVIVKTIILIFLLSFNIYAVDIQQDTLNSISNYSIKIGKGKTNSVYVFVDPMCKYSRKLIKKIQQNKLLQLINTYHVFLYRLPKYESDKLNQYIYQSPNKNKELLYIMTQDIDFEMDLDLDDFETNDKTYKEMQEIASVAKGFKMTKRPYLIKFDNKTGYCIVSEGIANCMEEFDLD